MAQGAGHRARGTGHRARGIWHRARGTGHREQKKIIPIYNLGMEDFRFEQLDIWNESIQLSDILFDYADNAEERKYYRFAEQLRASAMSISNNIAEGSGSLSKKEFANFLNIARRSLFECANILFIFERRKIINNEERMQLYQKLIILSKKITNFRKTLL